MNTWAKPLLPLLLLSSDIALGQGFSPDDNASFIESVTPYTPIGGVYNDTLGADLTEDHGGAMRMTAKRAAHVNFRNSSGTEIGTQSNPVGIAIHGGTAMPSVNRTDVSLSAQSSSSNSTALTADGFGMIAYTVNVTAISGTSAALQVDLEGSDDGSYWRTLGSSIRISATGSVAKMGTKTGAYYYRYRWFITGTTPSISFNVVTTLKAPVPGLYRDFNRYSDLDLTTVGNVSSTFSAAGCTTVTVQGTRGADGGNNGQTRIDGGNTGTDWEELTGSTTYGPSSAHATTVTGGYAYYQMRTTAATNAGTRVLNLFWTCAGG